MFSDLPVRRKPTVALIKETQPVVLEKIRFELEQETLCQFHSIRSTTEGTPPTSSLLRVGNYRETMIAEIQTLVSKKMDFVQQKDTYGQFLTLSVSQVSNARNVTDDTFIE